MHAVHFQMCMSHFTGVPGRAGNSIPTQPSPAAPGVQTPHQPASATHPSCPGHCLSPLQCSPSLSHHSGHQTPRGPSQPHCGQGLSSGIASFGPCCSPSRLLTTFSTPNFPVINIPASWQETCFSYAAPLLLREPFPAAPAPSCFSPLLRDIPGMQQNLLQHKDPKTPCKSSGSTTSCRSGLRSSCTS